MKRLTFVLACLPACLEQQTQLNIVDSVSGTVAGSDGTTIVGAYVTLAAVPAYPSSRNLQTQWAALSDANGAFSFTGLSASSYQVCAQLPHTQWLSPCAWGTTPPVVSLSAGQPTANVSVTMTKGVVVPIRVNDPKQLLAANEGITPGAQLLMEIDHPPFLFEDAGAALRATSASVPITVQAGAQPTVVTLVVTGGGQP